MLPVPATYIVDQNGKIKYVYFNPDYRRRVSVKAVAAALQSGAEAGVQQRGARHQVSPFGFQVG